MSLLGAAMISGGGLTLHGRNAGSAKAVRLVPSSRVFLGWREPDPTTTSAPPVQPPVRTPVSRSAAPRRSGSTGACGGGLPPCCVLAGESGGNLTAEGPMTRWGTAKGKWQILDSTWGHYKGFPTASSAPESVQDERARQIYAGGAGRGQWDARC